MTLPRRVRDLANQGRNAYLFRIRYPWVKVGSDVHCQTSSKFRVHNRRVTIGSHTGIGHECLFHAETHLGNDVLIASTCGFLNSDEHDVRELGQLIRLSRRPREHKIVVDDDVWIGYGCILLAPVHLGRGCVVAAGSVVRGQVEPYAVVAGVPAQTIGSRFNTEEIARHELLLARRTG